ncbi:hypothetical protein EVAR_95845_1 [Eumeta japonica]|uniref:Uncharacterized protein n=1 Tax=Eumeta variegata TaxID=151549 RepID=A0A4C1VNC6_EUMVA|nr:hypothetical protein EVAR_95845_1 [Eumeta japonica]
MSLSTRYSDFIRPNDVVRSTSWRVAIVTVCAVVAERMSIFRAAMRCYRREMSFPVDQVQHSTCQLSAQNGILLGMETSTQPACHVLMAYIS